MSDYLESLFSLKDRVAVVIGGTGVLCGRMAQAMALAGARVIVAGRSEEKGAERVAAIKQAGGSAAFHAVDVGDRASIQHLRDEAIRQYGSVDILVNGAGVNSGTPYFDITDDDWDRVIETNLRSLHQACQLFGKEMVERRHGSIINIASVSADKPLSKVFAYSASKAAVVNYTQNLAREFGPRGVRVNALAPGFFPAEQNRKILAPERIERIIARTPMGRFGEPKELDATVILLASDVGGSFINGATFLVDGGFCCMAI